MSYPRLNSIAIIALGVAVSFTYWQFAGEAERNDAQQAALTRVAQIDARVARVEALASKQKTDRYSRQVIRITRYLQGAAPLPGRGGLGVQGETGPASRVPGPQGVPGLGMVGEPGRDGENGRDGSDGAQGEQGEPGRDGENGRDGSDGAQGEQGEPGEQGEQGEDGKTVICSDEDDDGDIKPDECEEQ